MSSGKGTRLSRELARELPPSAEASTVRAFMKATVSVMPKQSILDPQGVAVRDAVRHHGVPGAKAVRVGKLIELDLDDATTDAQLHDVCRDLLSNPVVEEYQLTVQR